MGFVVSVNSGTTQWPALRKWLTALDKKWMDDTLSGSPPDTIGELCVREELGALLALMEDDRDRYLPEAVGQADAVLFYYTGLLGMIPSNKPWTRALMAFALQAAEFVAMHFKAEFNRIRPSSLCPGLLPPFGPPRHASFPSGHSTQCHLLSYVLLQIPAVRERFGEELVWLARRAAVNRERIGVHYRSDSTAGMHLALGVIAGLMGWSTANDILVNALEPIPPSAYDPNDQFGSFTVYPVNLAVNNFARISLRKLTGSGLNAVARPQATDAPSRPAIRGCCRRRRRT